MKIEQQCIFTPIEGPCAFHKIHNLDCTKCKNKKIMKGRILIIKLGAIGDVLRTTCILHSIKIKYKNYQINWLTKKESIPLLKNNPNIHRIIPLNETTIIRLMIEEFDVVISLDTDAEAGSLASNAIAHKKFGYGLNKRGIVYAFNKSAEKWLNLSRSDPAKKKNKKSYQDLILKASELDIISKSPQFFLTSEEINSGKALINNINNKMKKVCIIVGAGKKWPTKSWPYENIYKLIKLLNRNKLIKPIIVGGNEEINTIKQLKEKKNIDFYFPGLLPLRIFASFINQCDIVVTADTLALHISYAMKKSIIALIGPTSYSELDVGNKGVKLYNDKLECLCCYRPICPINHHCMKSLSPELVLNSINKLLNII